MSNACGQDNRRTVDTCIGRWSWSPEHCRQRRERHADDHSRNAPHVPLTWTSRHTRRASRFCLRGVEQFLDLESRVTNIPQPLLRILLEAPSDESAQFRWCVRRERVPRDIRFDNAGKHLGYISARKCCLARKHFVEHAAKRPNIRPLVRWLSPGLLGAHISGGPK